jgi:O-antigen/teichoic acid export membrane protein
MNPMTEKPKESTRVIRGTVVLTTGRVAGYGLSFLRNLILARMLVKADYGLAAVFGMAITLLEISSRISFGMQIIQSKEGNTPRFQASAHLLQFAGGVISALLIASLSFPLSYIFKVPHAWMAFAFLAVVPLSQGLSHLDVSRYQRDLEYLPIVLVDVVPQFLVTAVAWPLTVWIGNYRVIVVLMIAKAVIGTAMSFILAKRPYRWGWDRADIGSMLSFGWPLLLTGLIMFGSQQADQVMVGAVFSLNMLANYSLAFSLVSIPWFVLSPVGDSLMLPLLARAQDNPELIRKQYHTCIQTAAVAGVVCILPLILAGEQFVTLLYGKKYSGSGVFVAILGAAYSVRFLRYTASVMAMARADTINQLYSNLGRGISLPLALAVVLIKGTPTQIASCALVGEVLAAAISLSRLWLRQRVPLKDSVSAVSYLAVLMSLGTAFELLGGARLSIWMAALAAFSGIIVAVGIAWLVFPEVMIFIKSVIEKRHSRTIAE